MVPSKAEIASIDGGSIAMEQLKIEGMKDSSSGRLLGQLRKAMKNDPTSSIVCGHVII